MLEPKLLEALQAVVECGGFDKAAKRLFLTQSAVSQRIKQLEENLGQPVVTRTSPLEPTLPGQRLLRYYHQISLMEQDLLEILPSSHEASTAFTTLTLGVNADSLACWFLQAMKPFLKQQRIVLDVLVEDQDHTHTLMRNGQVTGCISTRSQAIQGSECLFLGHMRYLCLASDEFRNRYFPHGVTHTALAHAPAILFDRKKDDMHHQFLNTFFSYQGSFPAFILPTPQGFVDYTREGLAYSLLPQLILSNEIQNGQLVDLCPGKWVDLPLYWHHWRFESTLLHTLQTQLLAFAQQHLR